MENRLRFPEPGWLQKLRCVEMPAGSAAHVKKCRSDFQGLRWGEHEPVGSMEDGFS